MITDEEVEKKISSIKKSHDLTNEELMWYLFEMENRVKETQKDYKSHYDLLLKEFEELESQADHLRPVIKDSSNRIFLSFMTILRNDSVENVLRFFKEHNFTVTIFEKHMIRISKNNVGLSMSDCYKYISKLKTALQGTSYLLNSEIKYIENHLMSYERIGNQNE